MIVRIGTVGPGGLARTAGPHPSGCQGWIRGLHRPVRRCPALEGQSCNGLTCSAGILDCSNIGEMGIRGGGAGGGQELLLHSHHSGQRGGDARR